MRTFPNFSSNPKSQNYSQFCKYQLIKYKPWKETINDLWDNLPPSHETFCLKWKEFLNSALGQELVPNWRRLLNANNLEFQHDTDDDEDENENLIREDWMHIADLNSVPNITTSGNEQYWADMRDLYSAEQINSMLSWIEDR